MAKKKPDTSTKVLPISNLPSSDDKGAPDTDRDFVIIRLRGEIAHLRYVQEQLLSKLTYAQEILQSEKRFFEVGLHHDQWETYDQITRRRKRIEACIEAISDPNVYPRRLASEPTETKERKVR